MMMFFLLVSLLGAQTGKSLTTAESLSQFVESHPYFYYVYQQPKNTESNLISELLLMKSLTDLPKSIKRQKNKDSEYFEGISKYTDKYLKEFPEWTQKDYSEPIYSTKVENKNELYPFAIDGKKPPFKVKNLIKMFEQVLKEEALNGLTISQGEEMVWSEDFINYFGDRYSIGMRFSKLLICLMKGVCSRFMLTGLEDQLEKNILNSPDNSITLESIFRSTLRLSQGDVYLTLQTIENVLSRYWKIPNRQNLVFTKKLTDISNYHYETDKFGQWYHFFGIMLYGYVRGGVKATFVGGVEALGSLILHKEKSERQENYMNLRGGKVGGRLSRSIKKLKYLKIASSPKNLDPQFYMQLDEDFSKRIKKISREK